MGKSLHWEGGAVQLTKLWLDAVDAGPGDSMLTAPNTIDFSTYAPVVSGRI